jgi:hypothetical protein
MWGTGVKWYPVSELDHNCLDVGPSRCRIGHVDEVNRLAYDVTFDLLVPSHSVTDCHHLVTSVLDRLGTDFGYHILGCSVGQVPEGFAG